MLNPIDFKVPDMGAGVHFGRLPRSSDFTAIINGDALQDFASQWENCGDVSAMRMVASFDADGTLRGYNLEVYRPRPDGGRPFVRELLDPEGLAHMLQACGLYGRDCFPRQQTQAYQGRAATWNRIAHHRECLAVLQTS